MSKREILFIVKVVASSVTEQDIPDSYYVIGFLCRKKALSYPLRITCCAREKIVLFFHIIMIS